MHFIVQDTGIGIPKEKQKVIFEAFSQTDGSTTRKYGGMGLGLTISLRLVEMMQGSIWVESEVGRASRFHFTAHFGVPTESIPRRTTQHEASLAGLRVPGKGDSDRMRRSWFISTLLLLAGMSCVELAAQYAPNANVAQVGVVVPITITGGVLDTRRAQIKDPSAAAVTAGFRVLASPQLKLGSHWYIYSALQVYSTPFFYQDAYSADPQLKFDVLQAFVGYARSWGKATLSVKVGQLPTAFGAFPLRYDDTANPLLDQPLPYTYLRLFPRGAGTNSYGLTPATLYGLPGAETDLSWRRLDARFQLTNSSPYDPKSLFASSQNPQWALGGGYTIRQGFRVGMSAYRGPWLGNTVKPKLPAGSNVGDFPASGLGVDAQWARGRWSANGEWDRFVFGFPNVTTSTAASFGYVEVKRIMSPRWYAALRTNSQTNNYPVRGNVRSATHTFPNRQSYEFAVGFRPNRFQLLKVGYEWVNVEGGPRNYDNVFGVQFVTSIDAFSKAFK